MRHRRHMAIGQSERLTSSSGFVPHSGLRVLDDEQELRRALARVADFERARPTRLIDRASGRAGKDVVVRQPDGPETTPGPVGHEGMGLGRIDAGSMRIDATTSVNR
jgi:hypothetical protein